MISKKFNIPCTHQIKDITETGRDELIIIGIANTGLEDIVGDIVTREALESIAEQIPRHNLHLDHSTELDGILGPLLEGWIDENGYLNYKARIVHEKSEIINSYLQQGVNLGSSIAGVCEYEENSNANIIKWVLTEISLTGVPCDQNTMASVRLAKSFVDVVETVRNIKNEGANKMADEGNYVTRDEVTDMINTANNESREDLLQTVIEQVKVDIDAKLAEYLQRIESLESQVESLTGSDDDAGDDTGNNGNAGNGGSDADNGLTGGVDGNVAGDGAGSGTGKAEEEEDDEDKKPEDDEDDKEDEEKRFKSLIQKEVQNAIKDTFKSINNPSFNYQTETKNTTEGKSKKYKPEEIARILTGEL